MVTVEDLSIGNHVISTRCEQPLEIFPSTGSLLIAKPCFRDIGP